MNTPDIVLARRLAAMLLAAAILAPGRAHAVPLRLSIEPGAIFFVNGPQKERFTPGAAARLSGEYLPLPQLSVILGVGAVIVPAREGKTGTAYDLSAGLRSRPFSRKTHDRSILAGLFVELSVAYTRTERLNRVGLSAGLGFDFSLKRRLRLGPFLRYYYVYQPDGNPAQDAHDAHGVIGGVSFTLDFAPAPKKLPPARCRDADNDGLCDGVDRCPLDAEDKDNFEDDDGCPDLDDDQDGIPDKSDKCRLVPEDKDNFEDSDGCPDLDDDGDGIPDTKDKCRLVKEDKDGFEDDDGCPDLDNDRDGIPDQKDSCPNAAETVNCYKDKDGCPDDVLAIADTVLFHTGRATLRRGARALLRSLAAAVIGNREIQRLRIEGHADSRGSTSYNDRLSTRRASRVLNFMVRAGVTQGRLEGAGYGERCPAGVGHLRNRRVVFRIVCPRRRPRTVRVGKVCPRRVGHGRRGGGTR